MREVVILSSVRTAAGGFGGALKDLTAPQLGVIAAREAIRRAGVAPEHFDEAVFGNGWQAGVGPNTARLVSVGAGLPQEVPAYTVNKRCGSSLKAAALAAQAIRAGDAEVVLAGGTESTSNVPYIQPGARWGVRFGHAEFLDLIYKDGYMCPLAGQLMGVTAENLAERYNVTRGEQDAFALESQEKAVAALKGGRFEEETAAVELPGKKGGAEAFGADETPREGLSLEKLGKLKPVFHKEGSVTAGNSCCQADAAAALVVASRERAEALGARPIAILRGYASTGVEPKHMGLGPVTAIPKALDRAGLTLPDMDLIEVNEAFAAQVIACGRELKWDRRKLNVHGGAIALGHPVGATGAKLIATALSALRRRGEELAVVSACIGGGQGVAVVLQRVA
ncbi:MAG: acetyl-CoA C-acyltransferase [Candidatus Tectomicrobia bacterium]|nr:acetyl-CoA C-acyltransferase [Candidatus Tectomicrobia bacterium]